ncbi:PrsW family glutamic-type intramembrane protease [Streptomyces sp. AM 2-1-1]|uniref:PrsW family intramembrane metalloprotease n=1 Tax=Streptomyces sp. AM 2-1-1 TaxID=3028709 RepID=UPI0023B9334C|nr:PrsW family glutamic-type intramembrane protease [Streptomyces sp. AM 2-1-1]WEH41007.1 PrsW family glutamic-type intramembrane protease [Streptomyces sp. AM 2-1-1]
MSAGSEQHLQPPHPQPAVPVLEERRIGEILGAVPERGQWRYRPRRVGLIWRSRAFRAGAVIVTLAICGLLILALVREETGTEGFLVGLGLAVLPVPLLMTAFRWLDRVEPAPWRNLLFSFAWGSCAAALVAIIANSFATHWIAVATADPTGADTLGATVVAPIVEESAKGAAVLMIFLFRRREFSGIVDGIVVAGFTATGFAFTENILYLGNAFGEDRQLGTVGIASLTVGTFFVRIVLSPFAHPVFTVLTGIGFGFAATGRRRRVRRVVLPLLGLVLAMSMHALWNGSAVLGPYGFYLVYGVVMMPAFGLLTWLALWSRQRELRTLAAEFPAYAVAGWLTPAEPLALASMRARGMARDLARHWHGGADRARGRAAARAVAEYESFATSLAALRRDARRGTVGADFAAREQELLHHLWERRNIAAPALTHAARSVHRPVVRRPAAAPYGYGAHASHAVHRAHAPRPPQPWAVPPGARPPLSPYGTGTTAPYGDGRPAHAPAPQEPPPHQRYDGHNPYLHPPQ